MIECYKMLHDAYDIEPLLKREDDTTRRGHSLKLKASSSSKEACHNYFSLRVVAKWNSLPESIVTAPSLNSFKSRLDKHWKMYAKSEMQLPPCKIVETDNMFEEEPEIA